MAASYREFIESEYGRDHGRAVGGLVLAVAATLGAATGFVSLSFAPDHASWGRLLVAVALAVAGPALVLPGGVLRGGAFGALVSGTLFALAGLGIASVLLTSGVEGAAPWLGMGALAVLLSSSLLAFAIHRWSLVVIRALYRRVHHERLAFVAELGMEPTSGGYESVGLERQLLADAAVKREFLPFGFSPKKESLRLFHQPCAWCGHFLAPVLCSNCKSIQWGSLEDRNLFDILPPWNWAAAVFVGEHRFRLLQVGATVAVAAVLGLGAEGAGRIRAEESARTAIIEGGRRDAEGRARDAGKEVVESAVGLRSAMLTVEAACGNLPEDLREPACQAAFDHTVESYYRLSWFAPPVLEHLRSAWCSDPGEDPRRIAACDRLRQPSRDPVQRNDERFRKYWGTLWEGGRGEQRSVAAWNLYGGTREVTCLVSWFVWDAEASRTPWMDGECQTLVRNGWEDQDSLPPCGLTIAQQELPGAAWACWERSSLPQ